MQGSCITPLQAAHIMLHTEIIDLRDKSMCVAFELSMVSCVRRGLS